MELLNNKRGYMYSHAYKVKVVAFPYRNYKDLHNVYKNPSKHKEKAYNECVKLMHDMNGYDHIILSYNCQSFTFAFRCYHNDFNDCIVVCTPNHDYIIPYNL